MASIDECKKLLENRITKSGFSGNLSPNVFNTFWQSAERRHFDRRYKQYLINQKNIDALSPFKSDPVAINIDLQGKYTRPSDLLHIDAIRHLYNNVETEITEWQDDRLGNKLSSTYDAPTLEFPIYTPYSTYLQFHPKNIGSAIIIYLKKLTNPSKWGYTLSGGRPVYDPATSVQPLWNDGEIDEIIYLIGEDLGLNLRDQLVMQDSSIKAKENF